jgi:uncharacterized protein YbaP (TraB family)
MKLKNFFLTVFVTFYSLLSAQGDGLLWKISGNGLTKPSYLFGTIHAYCDKDKIFTEDFISTFKTVDVVAMELNLNDFSTFVYLMKSSMQESKRSISSFLTEDERLLIDRVCQQLLGDSLKNLDKRTPMALLGKMYLSDSFIGCSPIPLDFIVAELAKRNNKESYGLESPQFQDSLLNSIPDSMQVKWLLEFARDIQKAKFDFKEMLKAYDSQQSKLIYEISFKTSPEVLYLKDILLDNRNKNWVSYLQRNMFSNSYFVAVGAAHLAGDLGMVELLKKAGFKLEPILINFNK